MKKIEIKYTKEEFEEFVNKKDINVLSVNVKIIEPSSLFSDGFIGTIFYEEKDTHKVDDFTKIALEAARDTSKLLQKKEGMKSRSLFYIFKKYIKENYEKRR